MKYLASSILALGVALPAFAGTDGTITNGNMESQRVVDNPTWATGPNIFNVTPYVNDWNTLNPAGEAFQSYGNTPSPDGGKYWGVQYDDGWYNPNSPSVERQNAVGISQGISGLTVGQTYEISFWSMANHTQSSTSTAYWSVGFEGATQKSTALKSDGTNTWVQDTLTFVATSATSTLSFTAMFANATPGVTPTILNLDGVSIAAVPEPAEAALWMAGLLALGAVTARRRAQR